MITLWSRDRPSGRTRKKGLHLVWNTFYSQEVQLDDSLARLLKRIQADRLSIILSSSKGLVKEKRE